MHNLHLYKLQRLITWFYFTFQHMSYQTLQSILQYAYTGEVLVSRDKISEFLDACKALHIKGVEDLVRKYLLYSIMIKPCKWNVFPAAGTYIQLASGHSFPACYPDKKYPLCFIFRALQARIFRIHSQNLSFVQMNRQNWKSRRKYYQK